MRILITGGFGFVGGRLAAHLARSGYDVILGSRRKLKAPNWLPQAKVVQIEWENQSALEKACDGINVIIQAAGMNSQECTADPAAALHFNGVSTGNLVAAASLMGVQQFIYISTVHVYASMLEGVITEKSRTLNRHPYATSHLAGENAVLTAHKREEINGMVMRLSNAFGAPMYSDVNCWMLLVNDLCKQVAQTHKMMLQTNGAQLRDFIGMTRVCQMIEHRIFSCNKPSDPEIFNICSGISKSVLEMSELIKERCKIVLGFDPDLRRSNDAAVAVPSFTIRSNVDTTPCHQAILECELAAEIDSLLAFCNQAFPMP